MKYAHLLLRLIIGIIFITHGLARLYYQSVNDFGTFLESKNIPFGVILAWIITLGEIVSGGLLTLGKWVKYAVVFHALIILGGISMVHLSNGWFVVGHGTGGVEYSILILAVLFFLFSKEHKST